ncbi:MAG: shikimate kinase [Oscillospiraceae bacterium]|nr:shikimate kinase [Oscillospiraceae bacterium]
MTIYLSGFMGCGKTTIGKVLAAKTGLTYTDLDSFIVQCERMSIPNIFAQMGESYFRQRETQALTTLGDLGGIIACGGGAMLDEKNAVIARGIGKIVFIDTPFDVCYSRIEGDLSRPLVVSNTRASLMDLYDHRRSLYLEHSDIQISGIGSPDSIADVIIEKAMGGK